VIPTRFRFIDLRARATAARDKLVSTSCPFAHAGLNAFALHYQLAWRQGKTSR
jgi:hypothetical protein